MAPLFLNKVIESSDIYRKANISKVPILSLRKASFDLASKFHLEGVYLIRGFECKDYSDLKYVLHLNGSSELSIDIAKGNHPFISKEYYEDCFINYDKAYFCSKNYEGIDLESIPEGLYKLEIEIVLKVGYSFKKTIEHLLKEPIYSAGGRYKLSTIDGLLYLEVLKSI